MKFDELISEEQLNAFLDNELDPEERAKILEAIRKDKTIAEEVCALRQIKDMVTLAYREAPKPGNNYTFNRQARLLNSKVVAMLMLVLGTAGGWVSHTLLTSKSPDFETLAQVNPHRLNSDKVMIHINSMNHQHIEEALDITEKLLNSNKKITLEIIANEEGLGLLRAGSPYRQRIHSIVSKHKNIKFLACGIAMKTAKLKEGSDIKLIPEAHKIPAALEEILKGLKSGWTYIKG